MPDQTQRPDPDPAVDPATALPPPDPMSTPVGDYDESGVPTFEYVRDKIEKKFATALGAEELVSSSEEGRSIDEQLAEREKAARERLEQLRRSLGQE